MTQPYSCNRIPSLKPEAAALLPQSSSTVASWILRSFKHEKNIIRLCLQESLSDIHITLDLWTSPNLMALLGVVAHFADSHGKLNCALLALDEVEGMHTGENICETFLHVANDYEIRHKLGYFVMDNATNNDTLMEALEEQQASIGLDFDQYERRLRCNGHVINLSVQAFLFGESVDALRNTGIDVQDVLEEMDKWRKMGPLGKAHNIAIHSQKTPARIKQFRALSGGLLVTRDNSTRWNSWADMLKSLLRPDIKHAVDDYIDEHLELEHDRLTKPEWKRLEKIHHILDSFRHATKATEGSDATLTKVLPSIDFLLNTYSVALEDNAGDIMLTAMIRIGWEKLDKYYCATTRAPVYLAAVVLNPRLKWRYFEVRWKPAWVRDGKRRLRDYWIKYRATVMDPIEEAAIDGEIPLEKSAFTQWMDIEDSGSQHTTKLDDYDRYCANPEPEKSVKDALPWWLESRQQQEYPTLAQWAINIHSIPAMSAEPERIFSGAKKTISHMRYAMNRDSIEATQCLKSWQKTLAA